jgi:hypothetical protein
MRVQPFAYVKTFEEAVPVGPTLFPEWEQTWDATLSAQYLDALDSLSGSTYQQMSDMNWDISASLLISDTNDYEAAVIKDKWIVAASFATNTLLKIDTTANSASLHTLDAGDTPSSRMRGGFAPSGSDSIYFRNNNGEVLRFNPDNNFAELFTTSSNITVGPSGGTPDWNWKYFGSLNSGFVGDQNYSFTVDGNNSASFDFYEYTGSVNRAANFLNPDNGRPTSIAYNSNEANVEYISSSREYNSTGSSLSGTNEYEACELMPYYNSGVRDGWQVVLTNVQNAALESLHYYRNGSTQVVPGSGRVVNPKPRMATIGPNGRFYYFNSGSANLREYDFTTNTVNDVPINGAVVSALDFNYRIFMASNGAMYLIPFINGNNVYRISLPLTGSDADNIYNLTHSPFYNKGK